MSEDKAPSNKLVIVISAPSGTGKTSICRQLLAVCPNLGFSVSYTTRVPRPGEKDGKDYYFISEKSFKEKIAQGEFVEWVENYGQFYGTSRVNIESCLEMGRDLLIDVEPRGAGNLKRNYPSGIFVFILPPSMEELKNRLIKRGFDEVEEMQRRLHQAYDEIKEVVWYDYIIFNDKLDEAVDQLRAIYVAEKTRRERLMGRIGDFLKCPLEKAI
ncbi:MAG: guanylate kinase [Syntrophales bacterium LBB04]|nr:guanylate kinase [Syntrophales bacterium LBB04]